MTLNELIEFCNRNEISLDTHIAIRDKDDHFLTEDKVYLDRPYFGNCRDGSKWQDENCPVDEDGCIDDTNMEMLILDSE